MRAPLSLHARLALMAVAMVCVPLGIASYVISNIVTVVSDNMDVALDVQIRTLDQAIGPDGSFAADRLALLPEFSHPLPGWSWRVQTPRGQWSGAFPDARIRYPTPRVHPVDGIYSGQGTTTAREALHVRRLDRRLPAGPASAIVIAPSRLIDEPMAKVARSVRLMQLLVLAVLGAAMALQLHFGLRPLRVLVRSVARVRVGEAQGLSSRQPAELAPLAEEINSLIARNTAQLTTARLNAANLAHALKTPLASLMLQLEQEGASANSRGLVDRISAQVARHLRRARSAAGGLGGRAQSDAHAIVEMIRPVLMRLRGEQGLEIENRLPGPCACAVDREDLGEMLGALLENACRYARGRVRLHAEEDGRSVTLVIEDDGEGIPTDQMAQVLQPGVRLDEVHVGYGFGLAIVRELAELYEGALTLTGSADLGGLRAVLRLPRGLGVSDVH